MVCSASMTSPGSMRAPCSMRIVSSSVRLALSIFGLPLRLRVVRDINARAVSARDAVDGEDARREGQAVDFLGELCGADPERRVETNALVVDLSGHGHRPNPPKMPPTYVIVSVCIGARFLSGPTAAAKLVTTAQSGMAAFSLSISSSFLGGLLHFQVSFAVCVVCVSILFISVVLLGGFEVVDDEAARARERAVRINGQVVDDGAGLQLREDRGHGGGCDAVSEGESDRELASGVVLH
nr:MAG TPA: hypothetical protein [Caudoviricetes sp.]